MKSKIRSTETRKACEALLDQIREVLADREEGLATGRQYVHAFVGVNDERRKELATIGERIAKLAEREGLRWGEETEVFLDGFDDLPETEDAPIPVFEEDTA